LKVQIFHISSYQKIKINIVEYFKIINFTFTLEGGSVARGRVIQCRQNNGKTTKNLIFFVVLLRFGQCGIQVGVGLKNRIRTRWLGGTINKTLVTLICKASLILILFCFLRKKTIKHRFDSGNFSPKMSH